MSLSMTSRPAPATPCQKAIEEGLRLAMAALSSGAIQRHITGVLHSTLACHWTPGMVAGLDDTAQASGFRLSDSFSSQLHVTAAANAANTEITPLNTSLLAGELSPDLREITCNVLSNVVQSTGDYEFNAALSEIDALSGMQDMAQLQLALDGVLALYTPELSGLQAGSLYGQPAAELASTIVGDLQTAMAIHTYTRLEQAHIVNTLRSNEALLESSGFSLGQGFNGALQLDASGALTLAVVDLQAPGAGFTLSIARAAEAVDVLELEDNVAIPVHRCVINIHGHGYDLPPTTPEPLCEQRGNALARVLVELNLLSAEEIGQPVWLDETLRELCAQLEAHGSLAQVCAQPDGVQNTPPLIKFVRRAASLATPQQPKLVEAHYGNG